MLRPFLDTMMWIYARPEVGWRRVVAKGADSEQFINEWMAQENAFLAEHRPWECADLFVAGELGEPSLGGKYGNVVRPIEGGRSLYCRQSIAVWH
jgi:hypothetical protein